MVKLTILVKLVLYSTRNYLSMHVRSPDIIEYILIIDDKNAWCDQFKVASYLCSPKRNIAGLLVFTRQENRH
jgi:hypothetical protein